MNLFTSYISILAKTSCGFMGMQSCAEAMLRSGGMARAAIINVNDIAARCLGSCRAASAMSSKRPRELGGRHAWRHCFDNTCIRGRSLMQRSMKRALLAAYSKMSPRKAPACGKMRMREKRRPRGNGELIMSWRQSCLYSIATSPFRPFLPRAEPIVFVRACRARN